MTLRRSRLTRLRQTQPWDRRSRAHTARLYKLVERMNRVWHEYRGRAAGGHPELVDYVAGLVARATPGSMLTAHPATEVPDEHAHLLVRLHGRGQPDTQPARVPRRRAAPPRHRPGRVSAVHDLDAHARALIEANLYMTLGTADAEGRPWLSPVYFATADYAEFYWVSARDAAHSRNIAQRPQMSLVIFDSQVPTYHGRGLPVGNSLRTRRPRPRPPHRDLPRSGDPRGLTGDGSRRTNPRGGDQSYGRGAISACLSGIPGRRRRLRTRQFRVCPPERSDGRRLEPAGGDAHSLSRDGSAGSFSADTAAARSDARRSSSTTSRSMVWSNRS